MTIQVGDTLPSINLTTMTAEGPKPVSLTEISAGKKMVLFAVPGAFTPTCSAQHLPGFIEKNKDLKEKGIDIVACVSVNDPNVMYAWGESQNVQNKIFMAADPFCEFTKLIGADIDKSAKGMGIRSSRYTMLIENKIVKKIKEEEDTGVCEISSAENFLNEI